MKNLHNIITLIKEDEEQKKINLDKFVDKQLKKNKDIVDDEKYTYLKKDLDKKMEEIYYIDTTPNKMYVSKMIRLLLKDVMSEFSLGKSNKKVLDILIKTTIVYKAYFKLLENKSNLLEYSIPITKMNQFESFSEVNKWVKESTQLLEKRIKERKIKNRKNNDENLKWGDYLIFENKKIGGTKFDCYLVTDFKTAKTLLGGFAKWCWTKEPGYWNNYTKNGLLFVLENKDIKNFAPKSPPEKSTQEGLIACYYKPNNGWGEINHLNNRSSYYIYDVESSEYLFREGFEEATKLGIDNFKDIYDKDDDYKILNIFPGSEIIGDKIVINEDIYIAEEDYIDNETLSYYDIIFLGDVIKIWNNMIGILIHEATDIESIDVEDDCYISISKANYINEITLKGDVVLGEFVKEVNLINLNKSALIDCSTKTKINKINTDNLKFDLFDLKIKGRGEVAIWVSDNDEIHLKSYRNAILEIKYAKADILISGWVEHLRGGDGSYVVIPDVDDNRHLKNLKIKDDSFNTITTTMSMALEDKIDVENLEKLIKDERIILLDDINGDYQPYEYNESHWENGKFIF